MNLLSIYSTGSERANIPAMTNKPVAQKKDVIDIISDKFASKRDVYDTVTMPRAIFKGYLCFTAGTAINAIAGMLKKSNFSKALGITSSLISIYGTYNFVKPFLVRNNENLTKKEK